MEILIKKNYLMNLIFILSFYILLAPFFEFIFNPIYKNYILNIKIIFIEILKFSIVNIVLFKIKNNNIKKLIIFLSIFIYGLGYNVLMFCLTILFQKNLYNINYENMIYTYIAVFIGLFIPKYRVVRYVFEYDLKSNISIILFIICIIIIIPFMYYIHKKGNINLNSSLEILEICIMLIIIYQNLFHDDNYFNLYYKEISTKNRAFNSCIFSLIMMFIFYYFDISIKDKNVSLLIYISFTYFILYAFIRSVISYKIMGMIILIYTVFLILDKKIKIVDKIKNKIEKYKLK